MSSENLKYENLVYTLRDPQTQSYEFRQTLESLGEYLALEISEELDRQHQNITTLTKGTARHFLIAKSPVLVTILRAGLPLNQGAHKVFKNAKVGFLAMSRSETTLKAKLDYVALPDVENQVVIITDTMIATGGSLVDAIKVIESKHPKQIMVMAAIASEQGIARIQKHNPNIKIFAAVIDPTLDAHGFIVPGLGDAGDRAYGPKQ